jgi:DNA-binding PadR family transcriptional regulator
MVPDTRYAILGLLERGPSHGYKITKLFGGLLGPGWEISSGQVYDMLGNLERKGWVKCLTPPGTPKDSKTYRIMSAGERELAGWRAEHPLRSRAHRETLYLKLVLAGPENAHHVLKDIELERQACLDKLAAYTANACPPPEDASEWETLAREAIDEDVTTELHGKLEWLEKTEKRIKHRLSEHPLDTSEETDVERRRKDEAA